jgi:branched-subunit amino acid aminotransferase/4-amino-4-deoxychorismate lyase
VRSAWVVAVRASGVDDVLLVHEGRFKEATTAGIVAVIGGDLWVHPEDGTVLPSTTVSAIRHRALRLGIGVREARISSEGPWDGLYVASVLRDLAPVVELDGRPVDGADPVGRRLMDAP